MHYGSKVIFWSLVKHIAKLIDFQKKKKEIEVVKVLTNPVFPEPTTLPNTSILAELRTL